MLAMYKQRVYTVPLHMGILLLSTLPDVEFGYSRVSNSNLYYSYQLITYSCIFMIFFMGLEYLWILQAILYTHEHFIPNDVHKEFHDLQSVCQFTMYTSCK